MGEKGLRACLANAWHAVAHLNILDIWGENECMHASSHLHKRKFRSSLAAFSSFNLSFYLFPFIPVAAF